MPRAGGIDARKFTLPSGLAGVLELLARQVHVDAVDMGLLDLTDVRRDIGLMGQGARLFHGTLRKNLPLARRWLAMNPALRRLVTWDLADFARGLSQIF